MGDLPAVFQLLTDLEKSLRFGSSRLVGGILTLGGEQAIIGLHYCNNQASRGNFRLGPGHRLQCAGTREVGNSSVRQHLVHVSLAYIFMNSIVGNKSYARRSITLAVKILSVVADVGQKRRSRLYLILMSNTLVCEGCLKINTVLAGQRHCILQSEGLRRLRIGRSGGGRNRGGRLLSMGDGSCRKNNSE